MLRKIWRAGLIVGIILILAGADIITEANVTPNPNGKANTVEADGTFKVDPANNFVRIFFSAKLQNSNPPQFTITQATPNMNVTPMT